MTSGARFTCSIDDGHPSDLRMAELLQRHGVPATFYLPINNREGEPVMSGAQMRELASAFEIGSHTLDHCFLAELDAYDSHWQITEGRRRLEDVLGRRVEGFCYPGGKFGERDRQLVQGAGFRYARTTVNLCLDGGEDPYAMPVTVQFYPHPRSVLLRNFVRAGHWRSRKEALHVALDHADWLTRLQALLDLACEVEGSFHLWTHARDLDALDAWDDFEDFLRRVVDCVPPERRVDNGRLAALCY